MGIGAIGLLGGSFDPPHLAHIALAQAALRELHLQEVQLIPASAPWQRGSLAAAPEQRLAMLKLAVHQAHGLSVNPVEIQRGGKTYTIDTVRQLPAGPHYVWILGADQLANFCTWHAWQEIASRVSIAVAQRPGAQASAPRELQSLLDQLERPLLHLPFTPMSISASEIRERLAKGYSVGELLDPAVALYIEQHHLYRSIAS